MLIRCAYLTDLRALLMYSPASLVEVRRSESRLSSRFSYENLLLAPRPATSFWMNGLVVPLMFRLGYEGSIK